LTSSGIASRIAICLLPLALIAAAQSPTPQVFGYRDFTQQAKWDETFMAVVGNSYVETAIDEFIGNQGGRFLIVLDAKNFLASLGHPPRHQKNQGFLLDANYRAP